MLEIIPSVNCPAADPDCVVKKARAAESFAQWVHLDIADGAFTFHKSWDDPAVWKSLGIKSRLEVHLMVEHPLSYARKWVEAGAERIIVHAETLDPETAREIARMMREKGGAAMLAINPETPLEKARPYFDIMSEFQIFSQAYPGPAGQKFLRAVLPKIKSLRQEFPGARIEVDGGVDRESALLAKEAGANVLVAGTYTLGSDDPKRAYEELKSV